MTAPLPLADEVDALLDKIVEYPNQTIATVAVADRLNEAAYRLGCVPPFTITYTGLRARPRHDLGRLLAFATRLGLDVAYSS